MTIKIQRPIKIINDCGALIDESDVAQAIIWASKIKKRRILPIADIAADYSKGKSINSLAKKYHVDWTTIRSRLDENPELLEAKQ